MAIFKDRRVYWAAEAFLWGSYHTQEAQALLQPLLCHFWHNTVMENFELLEEGSGDPGGLSGII